MKSAVKTISIMSIVLMLFSGIGSVSASAADESIVPYYNNVNIVTTNFTISSSGLAAASVGYVGYSGITSRATIKSYIQKKTLGLIWTRVNNGQPNKEWVDYASGSNYINSHTLQLNSTGQYRLVVEYSISGGGGATDVIPVTIERTY